MIPGEAGGGQTGIRTLGTRKRSQPFQGCAIDHSAICPEGLDMIFY